MKHFLNFFLKPRFFLSSCSLLFGFFPMGLMAAGTIQITGQGEASAPPDLFSIDVRVTSICYDSTHNAKLANADTANKIVTLSKRFLRGPNDKVTTHPGSFMINTEYIPSSDGHSRILCERKWKTWNTIRIKINDVTSLPEVQDELVKFLGPLESIQPEKQEQTYAELSSPHFALNAENQNSLRRQSQQAALNDAKEQFKNFDANCRFTSAKLNSVAPPHFTNVVRYAAKAADAPEASTPVIPENISVKAVWNFTWEFESAPGCYQ